MHKDVFYKVNTSTHVHTDTHDLIVHYKEWPLNYSISIPWNFIQPLKEQKKLHKMFKNKRVSVIISTTLNTEKS